MAYESQLILTIDPYLLFNISYGREIFQHW
jgi:hypothetical protein